MQNTIRAASFCLLIMLVACGGDEAKPVGENDPNHPTLNGFQEGDPDKRLVNSGLGKEDFALIEAELQCVQKAFTGEKASKASAAIIEKWITTEEWVQGVRAHVKAEKEFGEKIQGAMGKHAEQVCPDGVPTVAFLTELGVDGLAPPTEAEADVSTEAQASTPAEAEVEAKVEAGDVAPGTEPSTDSSK